jgi:hypothetical protein
LLTDEQVFSRDEWRAEFALNNFGHALLAVDENANA